MDVSCAVLGGGGGAGLIIIFQEMKMKDREGRAQYNSGHLTKRY